MPSNPLPPPDTPPAAAPTPAAPHKPPRSALFRGRACPLCSGTTERVARHFLDRLLSVFMPVSRYRCRSARCTWEGALRPRSSEVQGKASAPRRRRPLLEASRVAGSAAGTLLPRGDAD